MTTTQRHIRCLRYHPTVTGLHMNVPEAHTIEDIHTDTVIAHLGDVGELKGRLADQLEAAVRSSTSLVSLELSTCYT